MLSPVNILVASLWFLSALIDYNEFCYLWQLKEYRWDRFRDFLSTRAGKAYWLRYHMLWRSLAALVVFFWPINEVLFVKYTLIGIYAIDVIRTLIQYIRGLPIYRPKYTPKAIIIIVLAMAFSAGEIWRSQDWSRPFLVLLLRFFILSAIVLLLNLPTRLLKAWITRRAAAKLKKYPRLLVIGVTGSYGKSSVKTFLTSILGEKFRMIATPQNINTDIGVAKFILKNNFSGMDIFIVEMGAYRTGEIKAICDIVHPRIGILTAINEQHLSLFGSIQNTQAAKYELLRSIPKTGLCIVNSDNAYCREFIGELPAAVQTFGYEEEFRPACIVKETSHSGEVSCCQMRMGNENWDIKNNLRGEHQCMNLAPCMLVARHLGMGKDDILATTAKLKNIPGKLSLSERNKAIIINDSYNSNPEGFKSALEVLKSFSSSRRRVIVTRGMLELGEKSAHLHECIGEEISLVADELIIISRDNEPALRRGVGEKFKTEVKLMDQPDVLRVYLRELAKTECVILVENRLPAIVAEELFGQSDKDE